MSGTPRARPWFEQVPIFEEDNEVWRAKGRRVPWGDRVELIRQEFPGVDELDWEEVLLDFDIFGAILRDIIKQDQKIPGQKGTIALDVVKGMQSYRELIGDDYSDLPFVDAFAALAFGNSLTVVARKTDISRSRVHRLMRGEEHPAVEDFRLIATAYGKKPAYFTEYRAEYVLAAMAIQLQRQPELATVLYRKVCEQ